MSKENIDNLYKRLLPAEKKRLHKSLRIKDRMFFNYRKKPDKIPITRLKLMVKFFNEVFEKNYKTDDFL
jgi:hypothetical protein